jgi:peptidoglycan-associated lipoprotein
MTLALYSKENVKQVYFSSRRQGGRGADDIYMFYLPPIIYNMIGKVTDDKTKTPVNQATVKLIGSDGAIVYNANQGGWYFQI